MEEKEYTYFVSYTYKGGFGNMEITQDAPMSMKLIQSAERLITDSVDIDGVIISNFILLEEKVLV